MRGDGDARVERVDARDADDDGATGVRATTSARAGMGPAVEPVEAPTREVRRSRRSSARGRWEMGARRWFVRSGTSVRTRARAR